MSVPPPAPTLRADPSALHTWLQAALEAVERRGVDAQALLRQAGLDLSAGTDPMGRHSARRGLLFWQAALQATGDELLGLDVALQSLPLNFNALGYALMASQDLAQMYARLARYVHVVTDAAELSFEADEHGGRLTVSGDRALLAGASEATSWSIFDYAMLAVVRGSRMLWGRDFRPLELRLQRRMPVERDKYERIFRCTPVYGCADNTLVVDVQTLHRPLSFANLAVARTSEEAMDRYSSDWQQRDLAQRLAAVLKDMLPGGEPRQQEVAERLGLSLRRLQRRLAEHETSYREVLNRTRHELALEYLGSRRHAVGEVAFLLGFSEVSAFTRAFKRWTGESPRSWLSR
ncbi:MAG: AraC family transcriptional regulator [Aquabacterium sp.]|nr:MAG: AraC family transcriptional regulator [Aquabacterium sp.]